MGSRTAKRDDFRAEKTTAGAYGKKSDTNHLDLISKRIEHHIATMNLLENIRWRFITSFGLAAFLTLFVTPSQWFNGDKEIVCIIAFIFSIAGIITQVRIFGLVISIYNKILNLQKKEYMLVSKSKNDFENIKEGLFLPEIGVGKGGAKYLMTVHTATCFVFSSLIGITVYILVKSLLPPFFSIYIGITTGVLFFVASYLGTIKYLSFLENNSKDR